MLFRSFPLPDKGTVYNSMEGLIQHFELIMPNRGMESPKDEIYAAIAPGQPAVAQRDVDVVEQVEIRAGLGIVGDRYFGRPAHRDAAVTVVSREWLPDGAGLVEVRRNILVLGVAVERPGVDRP